MACYRPIRPNISFLAELFKGYDVGMLFEPRKPHRRMLFISALDVILWAVLGIAFLLLDFVFRDILPLQDVVYLRLLMVASWIVVFILTLALAYLREK